jgi:hypothetical protein
VYTASKRFRAAAFFSLGAVVFGTAGRGETMGVGDAATGAIGRKKWFTGLHEILSRRSLIVRPYG